MSRRIRDNKTGKIYGSVAEVVQGANACRSAVYNSLRRGGRWEYTDEDLRRRDCTYYEEGKCRALDALYCKSEGDQCWRYENE